MRIAIAGATGLVGTQLTAAAESAGHDVVPLTRSHGYDLAAGAPPDLSGVDAVVDVVGNVQLDQADAPAFFAAVGHNLRRSGAPRKVLLSIIGVDETASGGGHYAAKFAQEQAYGDDVHILRAAQFEEFPEQILEWTRQGNRVEIIDAQIQPVAISAVVDALLALATGEDDRRIVEIAGPEVHRLPDLVRAVAPPEVEVVTVPASPAIARGALLPNEGAVIATAR